jgi:hypothetical protein
MNPLRRTLCVVLAALIAIEVAIVPVSAKSEDMDWNEVKKRIGRINGECGPGQSASISRNTVSGNRRRAMRPRTEEISLGHELSNKQRRSMLGGS